MINGTVTLGTLDGANVEIHESVGDENIILFGMTTPQVNQLKQQCYHPELIAQNTPQVREALEFLEKGIGGVDFHDIVNSLRNVDPYMVLAILILTQKPAEKRLSSIRIRSGGRKCAL